MPLCNGCREPCSCYLSEDGFWANRPQDGRRNTVITGHGVSDQSGYADPYELEFQQSEFYRPPSAEYRLSSLTIPSDEYVYIDLSRERYERYSSPDEFITLLQASPGGVDIGTAKGNFNPIGASVTFPVAASGVFGLQIFALNPNLLQFEKVAGHRAEASTTAPTYLNCAGFSSGVFDFFLISPLLAGFSRLNSWAVQVNQTSGNPITITDFKFWVTTI